MVVPKRAQKIRSASLSDVVKTTTGIDWYRFPGFQGSKCLLSIQNRHIRIQDNQAGVGTFSRVFKVIEYLLPVVKFEQFILRC